MAETAPVMGEKLASLLAARNMSQSELTRRVCQLGGNLLQTQISRYLRGTSPRPDIAVRIAQALDVDLPWLCDEADNSPPRRPGSSLTGEQLLAASADRYFAYAAALAAMLDQAERIDWEAVGDVITSRKQSDPPVRVHEAMAVIQRLDAAWFDALMVFSPMAHKEALSKRIKMPDEAIHRRIQEIMRRVSRSESAQTMLEVSTRGFSEDLTPDEAMAAADRALADYSASDPPTKPSTLTKKRRKR